MRSDQFILRRRQGGMDPVGVDLAMTAGAEKAGQGRPGEGVRLAKLLMRKG